MPNVVSTYAYNRNGTLCLTECVVNKAQYEQIFRWMNQFSISSLFVFFFWILLWFLMRPHLAFSRKIQILRLPSIENLLTPLMCKAQKEFKPKIFSLHCMAKRQHKDYYLVLDSYLETTKIQYQLRLNQKHWKYIRIW